MSKGLPGHGINYLGRVIAGRINYQTDRPDTLEMGVMLADKRLKLDKFDYPLLRTEYRVVRQLTRAYWEEIFGLYRSLDLDGTLNKNVLELQEWPYDFADLRLNIGDRVLCAWFNYNREIVVLDKITMVE